MKYIKIEEFEVNNGLGIGSTLYVSGCTHACKHCFNPYTWNKDHGEDFTKETFDYLIQCLKDKSRLTISGGDPLATFNRGYIFSLCDRIKEVYPSLEIWVYTGYKLQDIDVKTLAEMQNYFDYVIDGKYDENNTHLKKFRGSDNQVLWKNEKGMFKKEN